MTTQPPPADRPASQFTTPLRELAALALVGATAVLLLVALIRLIPDDSRFPINYLDYSSLRFGDFVNLANIAFPLVAVLLATHVEPKVGRAPLITLVALVELAVAAFFGLLFGTLLGFIGDVTNGSGRGAFEALLTRATYLAVLGVVWYAVFRVWEGLYHVRRPKQAPAPPGVYGQPQSYGQPPGYPQQSYPQPGYAPGHAQPPGYGQPAYPPTYGQPAPGAPQAYPPGYGPSGDPTQLVPPAPPPPPAMPYPATPPTARAEAAPAAPQAAPASAPASPAGGPPEDPARTEVIRTADETPAGSDDRPTQEWER
ncbi:MAG TPA: hypothetical protein VGJ53_07075 [Micromonosporaceae bacterium]